MHEHEPVDFSANIRMTYKQMLEVSAAIRSRLVYKVINEGDSDEFPYAQEQLEALDEVDTLLSVQIETALQDWEAGVARTEAVVLDDDKAIEDFLSPGWDEPKE